MGVVLANGFSRRGRGPLLYEAGGGGGGGGGGPLMGWKPDDDEGR